MVSLATPFAESCAVVSPTEPEVTIAHTKIFLARGWEIDETGGGQIFIATCHCTSPCELSTEQRSTICAEHWPSFLPSDNTVTYNLPSLVPRPRPDFRRFQYGKAGRAWYLFSREHDVIGKLQKFAELTGCVSRICNRLRAQRSVCKTIASR